MRVPAWALLPAIAALGCRAEVEGVPEGALALVGEVPIYETELAETNAQLGAYGQERFRGPEGARALLEAMIDQELMRQEAIAAGYEHDPRVRWAVLEEMAAVQLSAELERRVPEHQVATDEVALRAYYDAHLDEFTSPERRKMELVTLQSWDEADAALDKLKAGEAELGDYGEVIYTRLVVREDDHYPAFHEFLFDPKLKVGDWVPVPVLTDRSVLIGRVHEIEPGEPKPFDDPTVQERLTAAVRAPLAEAAREELMRDLERRFPTTAP